jgi:hypothetical protein
MSKPTTHDVQMARYVQNYDGPETTQPAPEDSENSVRGLALRKVSQAFQSLRDLAIEQLTDDELKALLVSTTSIQKYSSFILGRCTDSTIVNELLQEAAASRNAAKTDSEWIASLSPEAIARLREIVGR